MLGHAFEVWLLLVVAFFAGCIIGTAIHIFLASGRAAGLQEDAGILLAAWLPGLGRGRGAGQLEEEEEEEFYEDRVERNLWGEPIEKEAPGSFASFGLDSREVSNRPGFDEVFKVPPKPAPLPVEADESPVDDVDEEPTSSVDAAAPASPEMPPGQQEAEVVPPAAVEAAGATESERPPLLVRPHAGTADRLVKISGLGKRSAEKLNALGIYHFSQIAAWTPEQLEWIARELGPGVRPKHDEWIEQAGRLAAQESDTAAD